tara:strand:- start:3171 stop:3458 length:288 start_codon:yes stop_codon:yes gene_type:complete
MKKQKEKINHGMYAEDINGVLYYNAPDYQFTLTYEKYHNYATIIIKSKDIKLTSNNSGLANKDLKEKIINEWFADENDNTRKQNNAKRKEKKLAK